MIQELLKVDYFLFKLINIHLSSKFLDNIFSFFHHAHKNLYIIIPIFFLLLLLIYKDKFNRLSLILLLPGIILTDQIGRSIKSLELRERPYMQMSNINLLVDVNLSNDGSYKNTKSSKKSFPSNHAANIFFICIFLSFIYSRNSKYFLIIAIIISISRVYVGVHYPTDIIIGALLGLIVAYLIREISERLIR